MSTSNTKIIRVIKNDMILRASADQMLFELEIDQLPNVGWIQITGAGDENLYFDFKDDAGITYHGFCKCL